MLPAESVMSRVSVYVSWENETSTSLLVTFYRGWIDQCRSGGDDKDKEEKLHGGHQAVSPKLGLPSPF